MLTANRLRQRKAALPKPPADTAPKTWPLEARRRIADLERENARLRRELLDAEKRAGSAEQRLEEANELLLQKMIQEEEPKPPPGESEKDPTEPKRRRGNR